MQLAPTPGLAVQVIEAHGCEVAMAAVGAALSPVAAGTSSDAAHDRSALVGAVDVLSVALGLLINLAEGASQEARATMSATQAAPAQAIIPLLCRLVQVRPAPSRSCPAPCLAHAHRG